MLKENGVTDMQCCFDNEDEKRKSIVSPDNFNKNMFVEAGAGAGKTRIIVIRILNQLRAGIRPEELVVITFTKKAAAELYQRISSDLRKAVLSAEGEERDNLEKALRDIDKMTVSTIHSFCQKMIMEKAFDSKIPLDACVIDEDEDKADKEMFFERWYMDNITADVWKAISRFPHKGFVSKNFKKSVCSLFVDFCTIIRDNDTEIVYDKSADKKDMDYFEGRARTILEEINDKILLLINNLDSGKSYNSISEIGKEIIPAGKIKVVLSRENCFENLYKKDGGIKNVDKSLFSSSVDKAKEKMPSALRDSYIKWFEAEEREKIVSLYNEYSLASISFVTKYAIMAAEEYNRTRGFSHISNDDLLITAKDLIVNNAEARRYFADKYRCIYIDEFQDTDHIQEKMLFTLCLEEGSENRLRDGSLFVVGDPKQSIYRFRGAELDVYNELKEKMTGMDNACVYNLDSNFRSDKSIVDWVNSHFGKIIPGYSNMISRRSCNENIICGVYKYDREYGEEEKASFDTDAADLCRVIKGLVGNENICDKEGKVRKIKYSDFLVLTATSKNSDVYLNKFADCNIPVSTGMKNSVYSDHALSRFVILYSYLADRSHHNETGALEVVLGDDFFNNEMRSEGITRLRNIYYHTKNMDSYALAEYLLHNIDIFLPRNKVLNENEVYSAMTRIRRFTESVFAQYKGNRQGIAERFREMREKKLEREIPLEAERDAIRFMNYHQAKGLEGNIVIIAKRDKEFRFDKSSCRIKNENKGYRLYKSLESKKKKGVDKYTAYPQGSYAEEKAREEERSEYIRCEYVAATRAAAALIFMDPLKEKADFSEFDITFCPSIIYELREPEDKDINAEEYISPFREAELSEGQRAERYIKLNPSQFEKHGKYVPDPKVDKDIDENGIITAEETETEIKGAVFGTAMHRCFELFVNAWKEKDFDTDIHKLTDKIINQAIMEGLANIEEDAIPDYRKSLKKMLEGFMEDNELKNRIINAKAIYTELPFSYFINAEENQDMLKEIGMEEKSEGRIWINGTADLVIVNMDGSVVIIDYKSNVDKNDLDKRYRGQLTLYKYAISKLFDTDINKISFEIRDYR